MTSFNESIAAFINPENDEGLQISAFENINQMLASTNKVQDVIINIEKYLTSTEDRERYRATLLIAEILHSNPMMLLNSSVIHLLVVFFDQRLSDYPTIVPSLHALIALVRFHSSQFDAKYMDYVDIFETIFKQINVQNYAQTIRQKVYELMYEILCQSNVKSICSSISIDIVNGILTSFEGEKDPRCLLIALKLIVQTVIVFSNELNVSDTTTTTTEEELFERIFDSISPYFPITFQPPPDDPYGLKPEQLVMALQECMCSHSSLLIHVLPFLNDQLFSEISIGRSHAMICMIELCKKYTVAILTNTLGHISNQAIIRKFTEGIYDNAIDSSGSEETHDDGVIVSLNNKTYALLCIHGISTLIGENTMKYSIEYDLFCNVLISKAIGTLQSNLTHLNSFQTKDIMDILCMICSSSVIHACKVLEKVLFVLFPNTASLKRKEGESLQLYYKSDIQLIAILNDLIKCVGFHFIQSRHHHSNSSSSSNKSLLEIILLDNNNNNNTLRKGKSNAMIPMFIGCKLCLFNLLSLSFSDTSKHCINDHGVSISRHAIPSILFSSLSSLYELNPMTIVATSICDHLFNIIDSMIVYIENYLVDLEIAVFISSCFELLANILIRVHPSCINVERLNECVNTATILSCFNRFKSLSNQQSSSGSSNSSGIDSSSSNYHNSSSISHSSDYSSSNSSSSSSSSNSDTHNQQQQHRDKLNENRQQRMNDMVCNSALKFVSSLILIISSSSSSSVYTEVIEKYCVRPLMDWSMIGTNLEAKPVLKIKALNSLSHLCVHYNNISSNMYEEQAHDDHPRNDQKKKRKDKNDDDNYDNMKREDEDDDDYNNDDHSNNTSSYNSNNNNISNNNNNNNKNSVLISIITHFITNAFNSMDLDESRVDVTYESDILNSLTVIFFSQQHRCNNRGHSRDEVDEGFVYKPEQGVSLLTGMDTDDSHPIGAFIKSMTISHTTPSIGHGLVKNSIVLLLVHRLLSSDSFRGDPSIQTTRRRSWLRSVCTLIKRTMSRLDDAASQNQLMQDLLNVIAYAFGQNAESNSDRNNVSNDNDNSSRSSSNSNSNNNGQYSSTWLNEVVIKLLLSSVIYLDKSATFFSLKGSDEIMNIDTNNFHTILPVLDLVFIVLQKHMADNESDKNDDDDDDDDGFDNATQLLFILLNKSSSSSSSSSIDFDRTIIQFLNMSLSALINMLNSKIIAFNPSFLEKSIHVYLSVCKSILIRPKMKINTNISILVNYANDCLYLQNVMRNMIKIPVYWSDVMMNILLTLLTSSIDLIDATTHHHQEGGQKVEEEKEEEGKNKYALAKYISEITGYKINLLLQLNIPHDTQPTEQRKEQEQQEGGGEEKRQWIRSCNVSMIYQQKLWMDLFPSLFRTSQDKTSSYSKACLLAINSLAVMSNTASNGSSSSSSVSNIDESLNEVVMVAIQSLVISCDYLFQDEKTINQHIINTDKAIIIDICDDNISNITHNVLVVDANLQSSTSSQAYISSSQLLLKPFNSNSSNNNNNSSNNNSKVDDNDIISNKSVCMKFDYNHNLKLCNAALVALIQFMEHQTHQSSYSIEPILFRHVNILLPKLLQVAKFHFEVNARLQSLNCLLYLVKFPYHLLYPVKAKVLKELASVLDDKKKKIRLFAAKVRNEWFLLSS